MAAVDPPAPTYTPKLSPGIIEDGKLSEPQIEAVVYAGQSHEDILPSGQRRGFFIGDGTDVGKGREVSVVINDNWNQGRKKAIWISEKAALAKDAQRDIRGIGWDDKLLFELAKTKVDSRLATREGILLHHL